MQIPNHIRPAMWGFFVVMVCSGILLLVQLLIPQILSNKWNDTHSSQQKEVQQIVQKTFQNRVQHLIHIAENVANEIQAVKNDSIDSQKEYIEEFHILNSYDLLENQTIDLLDSSGNLIAWRGPSVASNYYSLSSKIEGAHTIQLIKKGLHIFLSVGIRIKNNRFILLVSEPLELQSPISNRFVQKVSFCSELSKILGLQFTLELPINSPLNSNLIHIPLRDQNNKLIASISYVDKTLQNDIGLWNENLNSLIKICLAIGSVFLAIIVIKFVTRRFTRWMILTSTIFILWIVRIIWKLLRFPSDIIGGWLFEPNTYAAPFVFELTSSLGDLFLSVALIAISTWIVIKWLLLNKQSEQIIDGTRIRLRKEVLFIFIFVGLMMLLWLFRGYHEAIRSIVFDSTIRFDNPSEVFLDIPALIMHFNILLLSSSFLSISVTFIWITRHSLHARYSMSKTFSFLITILTIIVAITVFAVIDHSSIEYILSTILFFIFTNIFIEFVFKWKESISDDIQVRYRFMLWIIIVSFFIGIPTLDQKLIQKEEKEVEIAASELAHSSDSWLTYVILDGLRSSVEYCNQNAYPLDISSARDNNLAFFLWAKTLFGKEGYNSSLILYDLSGNEVDRFVVGMSKQEQRDMLVYIFDNEEDVVHVLRQSTSGMMVNLYGAWSTVRDTNGKMIGSLALLLLETKRNIIQDEYVEPLRQLSSRFQVQMGREIAIHEYLRNSLVSSTGKKLYPIQILPQAIRQGLNDTKSGRLWQETTVNGKESKTLFYRDISDSENIIAISLENLDLRWKIFRILKECIIYIIILVVVGLFIYLRDKEISSRNIFGFREKIFLGFVAIALIPLIVLSYYNRQLVLEQSRERTESVLYSELRQIQDRIATYVNDEEDYIRGVDDDFCEALAGEYRIDFTVYKNYTIQASSKSELYRANLLDNRLDGNVFASLMIDNRNILLEKEKIGLVEYIVGYTPIMIAGNKVGVLAIPTLNRQSEIEMEMAQRNAFVFGAYALVFGIALVFGAYLALRFAQPVNALTKAARDVSRGNYDVHIKVRTRDEIGVLADSFNEMVDRIKKSRIELAKHERESAWKEMAKQIAHEIRNPLTPIKLSIQHLRQAFKDKAQNREEILERVSNTVVDQIDTLSRIASEFSSFAKLPEKKYEKLEVDKLLQETVDIFREVVGISFVLHLQTSSEMVIADRDQLKSVFINIIKNAIQSINKSGTITIESLFERDVYKIRISDTGHGIPSEILQKIFEPNFSTKSEGMGLGLAIARRVIEDHGGAIYCSSEIGKGTQFEINLPK